MNSLLNARAAPKRVLAVAKSQLLWGLSCLGIGCSSLGPCALTVNIRRLISVDCRNLSNPSCLHGSLVAETRK
eukprot:5533453-Amphidinium_carterae.1